MRFVRPGNSDPPRQRRKQAHIPFCHRPAAGHHHHLQHLQKSLGVVCRCHFMQSDAEERGRWRRWQRSPRPGQQTLQQLGLPLCLERLQMLPIQRHLPAEAAVDPSLRSPCVLRSVGCQCSRVCCHRDFSQRTHTDTRVRFQTMSLLCYSLHPLTTLNIQCLRRVPLVSQLSWRTQNSRAEK